MWRNDTENLPLFMALVLIYTLLGASLVPAQWLFGADVALRYAHSIAYLCRLQPWCALLYSGGMLVCWLLAVLMVLMVMA